jgi:hypothetical protein
VYNLNYTPTNLGVKVVEKLHLGVRETKVEYQSSGEYGSLDVSEPNGPPQPISGTVLPFFIIATVSC